VLDVRRRCIPDDHRLSHTGRRVRRRTPLLNPLPDPPDQRERLVEVRELLG
jgi:hypothetical protein